MSNPRSRRPTKKRAVVDHQETRKTTITKRDYRTLATLYHEYGPGEIVRGLAALLECDEGLHVADGVHMLSKRVHDVGDDLFRLESIGLHDHVAPYGTA